MNEQFMQENGVEAVQKPKKVKKRRSQSDKIGRIKYTVQLQKRILQGIEDLKTETRWVRRRLERIGEAEYTKSDVEYFGSERG